MAVTQRAGWLALALLLSAGVCRSAEDAPATDVTPEAPPMRLRLEGVRGRVAQAKWPEAALVLAAKESKPAFMPASTIVLARPGDPDWALWEERVGRYVALDGDFVTGASNVVMSFHHAPSELRPHGGCEFIRRRPFYLQRLGGMAFIEEADAPDALRATLSGILIRDAGHGLRLRPGPGLDDVQVIRRPGKLPDMTHGIEARIDGDVYADENSLWVIAKEWEFGDPPDAPPGDDVF